MRKVKNFEYKDSVSLILPTLGKVNLTDFINLINKIIHEDLIYFKRFEIIIVFNFKQINNFYRNLKKEYISNQYIKILHEPSIGIVKALNCGIKNAKYKYIARQDDDDFSYPNRIKNTYLFLKKHDLTIAFSKCKIIKNRNIYFWKKEILNPLKIQLLFYNPFVHATMLISKEWLIRIGGYKFFNGAEDHEMFIRLAFNDAKFGLLDSYLYEYNLDKSIRGKGYKRFFKNYIRSLKLILSNCLKEKIWFWACIMLLPSIVFQTIVLFKNIINQYLIYWK